MATQTATLITATAGGVAIKTAKETYDSDLITCSAGGYVSCAVPDMTRTIIYLENVSSTAGITVSVKSGAYSGSGIGDKDYSLSTDYTYIISGLDATRFKGSASSSTAGTAGNITIYSTGGTCVVGFFEVDDRL
jgi:hypothetical protein